MERNFIRLCIREKLQDGRLPVNSISSVGGRPGDGEKCDACDDAITNEQLTVEGISVESDGARPIIPHVACFQLWESERCALGEGSE
jgi:hypothetical protein